MTTTDEPQDRTVYQPETGHVGHQLRRSREAHGLSVTQIADNQHLRPVVIQAIEDGRYEKIGSELFLKGYVKAYAEQVGLAAAPLLQQLNKELEPLRKKAEAARQDHPLETIEREKRRKRRIARWVVLILAVAVIGLISLQLFDSNTATTGPQESDAAEATENNEATASSTSTAAGESADSGENATAVSGSTVEQPLVTGEDVAQVNASLTPVNSSGGSGQTGSSGNSAQSGVDGAVGGDADTQDNIVAESREPASESGESSAGTSLRIEFSGNCWVSVENGAGKTITASLKRAGDTVQYDGDGPFSLVLGAADQASVWFNGDTVDLAQYPATNNRVALTLGQ